MQDISPQRGVDRLLLPANKVQLNLQAQCPKLHQGILVHPIPNIRIPFLPYQCLHFSTHIIIWLLTWWDLGFGFQQSQLCSYRSIFQHGQRSFQSFIQFLGWDSEPFISSIFPPLCSVTLEATATSLYSLVWQKCLKVSHTVIQILASCVWLGISNSGISHIPIFISCHGFYHYFYSLLLETQSLASLKSDQIREPILETPEPTQRIQFTLKILLP